MRLNNPIGRVYRPVSAELAGKDDKAFNLVCRVLFSANVLCFTRNLSRT